MSIMDLHMIEQSSLAELELEPLIGSATGVRDGCPLRLGCVSRNRLGGNKTARSNKLTVTAVMVG